MKTMVAFLCRISTEAFDESPIDAIARLQARLQRAPKITWRVSGVPGSAFPRMRLQHHR